MRFPPRDAGLRYAKLGRLRACSWPRGRRRSRSCSSFVTSKVVCRTCTTCATHYQPAQVTRVLARDGTVLASLFVERRTVIPFT